MRYIALLLVPAFACSNEPTPHESIGADDPGSATAALTIEQCTFFEVDDHVTVCHKTSSAKNPYVVIRTNYKGCVSGHTGHPGDYIATTDPTCKSLGCFPEGAPADTLVPCCGGEPIGGYCPPIDACKESPCAAGELCTDLPAPADGGPEGRLCTSVVCGNKVKEAGEACDGEDVGGATCESLGLGTGAVFCSEDCVQLITKKCEVCDYDGVIDPDEQCDGEQLPTELSCKDFGFATGKLGCKSCRVTTGACTNCGNGAIDNGEVCDGSDVGGATCESLGLGTGPVYCSEDCAEIITKKCVVCDSDGVLDEGEQCDGDQFRPDASCQSYGQFGGSLSCDGCRISTKGCNNCGNGSLDEGEACEGKDFGGKTCASEGMGAGGYLYCSNKDCTITTKYCAPTGCDGQALDPERGEKCDGEHLGGATCESLGYLGGTLACRERCDFDTSGCTSACGDGVLQAGEACDWGVDGDGAPLNGTQPCGCDADCQWVAKGTPCEDGLSCTEGDYCLGDGGCQSGEPMCATGEKCTKNGCIVPPVCGNAVREGKESCDKSDLGGATCESLGFVSGTLACDAGCGFDTSGCVQASQCGNGPLDAGEVCDGADLAKTTCAALGFGGGTLACTECAFDTTGCNNCGNGQLDAGEQCDNGTANGASGCCSKTCTTKTSCDDGNACTNSDACMTVIPGHPVCIGSGDPCAGAGAACDPSDGTCTRCGDGVVQPEDGEACDYGANNGASPCTCTNDCQLSTVCGSGKHCAVDDTMLEGYTCSSACGNGVADPGEVCDGSNTGRQCASGTQGCWSNCSALTWPPCPQIGPSCGDGFRNQNEQCDGADLGGVSCGYLGIPGPGTLTCNGDCTFNVAGCGHEPVCGNGIVEAGEACDDPQNPCCVGCEANTGASCDDGAACTVGNECYAGVCNKGVPFECPVGSACQNDNGSPICKLVPCEANAFRNQDGGDVEIIVEGRSVSAWVPPGGFVGADGEPIVSEGCDIVMTLGSTPFTGDYTTHDNEPIDPMILADIDFTRFGEPVAVAPGKEVLIRLPVPESQGLLNVGDEVGFYSLLEEEQRWQPEVVGVIELGGDFLPAAVASVSHFTWYLASTNPILTSTTTPTSRGCVKVRAKNLQGQPLSGLWFQTTSGSPAKVFRPEISQLVGGVTVKNPQLTSVCGTISLETQLNLSNAISIVPGYSNGAPIPGPLSHLSTSAMPCGTSTPWETISVQAPATANGCDSGTAFCTSTCSCSSGTVPDGSGGCRKLCGNGQVDAGEACDGGSLCSATCSCPAGATPNGARGCTFCSPNPCAAPLACLDTPTGYECDGCGDSNLDPGEACDPPSGGACACAADCTYPGSVTWCTGGDALFCTVDACNGLGACAATTQSPCLPSEICIEAETRCTTCGNHQVDSGEECDSSTGNAPPVSCADLGFDAGVTDCDDACHLDAAACHDVLIDDPNDGVLADGTTVDLIGDATPLTAFDSDTFAALDGGGQIHWNGDGNGVGTTVSEPGGSYFDSKDCFHAQAPADGSPWKWRLWSPAGYTNYEVYDASGTALEWFFVFPDATQFQTVWVAQPGEALSVCIKNSTATPSYALVLVRAGPQGPTVPGAGPNLAPFPGGFVPPKQQRLLSAGAAESCALDAGGDLTCWGENERGQAEPRVGPFTSIAAHSQQTCALRQDGTLACWGRNDGGGQSNPWDDEPLGQSTPQTVPGPFCAIAEGMNHGCALRCSDGVPLCWGKVAGPPGVRGLVDIAAGQAATCGVHWSTALSCWGANSAVTANVPAGSGFTSVSVGAEHACALRADGAITCWGADIEGAVTGAPTGTGHLAVSAGNTFSCALGAGGHVQCWGSLAPTGAPTAGGFAQVAVSGGYGSNTYESGRHACARKANGEVSCWGSNTYGQALAPWGAKSVAVDNARGAGARNGCVLDDTNQVRCWGSLVAPSGVQFSAISIGGTFGAGLTAGGLMWWPAAPTVSAPPEGIAPPGAGVLVNPVKLAIGPEGQGGVLEADGTLHVWGNVGWGSYDHLGGFPGNDQAWDDVAFGRLGGCGLLDDGTVRCWGNPWTSAGSHYLILSAPPGSFFTALADSDEAYTECGLDELGRVVCFDGAFQFFDPQPFGATTGFVEVAVSLDHACVRKADGSAGCWLFPGATDVGQAVVPVGVNVVDIAATRTQTCFLDSDGIVRCVGTDASIHPSLY